FSKLCRTEFYWNSSNLRMSKRFESGACKRKKKTLQVMRQRS
ncbi:hypothetical protein X975_26545, partial [Stegodyphus mimosarum]